VTLSFELPPDFVDQLARRVAELTATKATGTREGYLDVEEAASYLACDKDRIYDLKSMGRLRYAKDGRRLLFRREWLDAALELDAR
jgi:excisionase family DNA binding protein